MWRGRPGRAEYLPVGSFDGKRSVRRRLTAAPRWAVAVLAVAVLVLVTLASLGSRGLPGNETRPPPFLIDVDLLVVFRILMGVLAAIAALLFVLLLLPGGPPVKLPERKKSSPIKMLAGIVMVFAIIMILQPFVDRTEQALQEVDVGEISSEIDVPGRQQAGSRWGLIVLGGAVLLVLLGIGAATRTVPVEEESVEPEPPVVLSGVIDRVLAELEKSSDPREVVIGAYARMEEALMTVGVPRYPSEAPLEYLARSLRRLAVSGPAVDRLTRLFEIARFSDHEVVPGMGHQAVAALSDIRNELDGVHS